MLGIEVGAIDDGLGGATSLEEPQMFGLNGGLEGLEQGLFELFKEEGERTADDDGLRGFLVDDIEEAERETSDKVFEMKVVEDEILESGDLIGLDEGFGRGEVFPFFRGVLIGVFDVAGLEGVGSFEKLAVFGDAAANAGGEGEIDGFAFFA